MAELRMTSLSVGKIIHKVLTEDETISASVTKVFPIVTDKAVLPYIAYRRVSHDPNVNKVSNPDTTHVEVAVFAADYEKSIELAEAVRAALDGKKAELNGLKMRICYFADGEEGYQDEAFVQKLVFTIKV